jgi:hypothetical protein
MNNKNPITAIVALCSLFVLAIQAHAEENVPDKFKIAIGGYAVGRYDSNLSLTESTLGAGASIDPQTTLGLDLEQTVTRLDGYYRFTPKHALTYSWYNISSTGNKTIEQDFEWLDENGNPITITAGAQANTILDYDIYKVGYLWSFYHTDKVELAAGAGLHLTRISVAMDVDTTSGPIDTKDVKTTVPLPVLSFGLTYHVTPKFMWYIKSEAFAISVDDWSGTYTDSTLAMEYRAWKNVGLGLGFGTNALKIIEDTGDYKFQYDNRISGLNLYVAGYF